MTSLDVCTLSGTGNTLLTARWLAEEAAAMGLSARVAPLDAGPPRASADLLCLATPTHGFTLPWDAIKWASRVPRGRGRQALVLHTRAGITWWGRHPPGVAASAPFVAALLLALRGWRVRGALAVNMPSNWMSLHPPQAEAKALEVLAHAEPRVRAFARRVLGGRRQWLTLNLLYEALNGLFLAPVSALYLFIGRKGLGNTFLVTERCNGCGLCARQCPVGALEMHDDRPWWTPRCESCMRCMAFCPKRAIEACHSWFAVLTLFALLPLVLLWLLPSGTATLVGFGLAFLAWNYAAVILGYAALPRLASWAPANRLLALTSIYRRSRRYRAPGIRAAELTRTSEVSGATEDAGRG